MVLAKLFWKCRQGNKTFHEILSISATRVQWKNRLYRIKQCSCVDLSVLSLHVQNVILSLFIWSKWHNLFWLNLKIQENSKSKKLCYMVPNTSVHCCGSQKILKKDNLIPTYFNLLFLCNCQRTEHIFSMTECVRGSTGYVTLWWINNLLHKVLPKIIDLEVTGSFSSNNS